MRVFIDTNNFWLVPSFWWFSRMMGLAVFTAERPKKKPLKGTLIMKSAH